MARPRPRLARPTAKLRAGRTDWYRIENHDGAHDDPAAVYIYEEIGYWGVTAKDFVKDLADVTASSIDLHLNSPGGDVFDGLAIYQALVDHPAQVTTVVDSLAASAASFIAMAGERVVMAPKATMMIHDALGFAVGNAADMRELADLLDKVSNNIASVYSDKAGGTIEAWRQAMLAESWYSAEEAVEAGLADEVRERTPATGDATDDTQDEALEPVADWDLSIFTYAARDEAPVPFIPARTIRPAALASGAIAALEGAFNA